MKGATLPNTFYNVRAGRNDTVSLTVTANGTHTLTFAQGRYTEEDVSYELDYQFATQFASIADTYAFGCAQDPATRKLWIYNYTQAGPYTGDVGAGGIGFSMTFPANGLGSLLGFTSTTAYNAVQLDELPGFISVAPDVDNPINGYYIVSDSIPNWGGGPFILKSDLAGKLAYGSYFTLTTNTTGNAGNTVADALDEIPLFLYSDQQDYIQYEAKDPEYYLFGDSKIDRCQIWFTYPDTDEIVDFNGSPFSVKFGILRRKDTTSSLNFDDLHNKSTSFGPVGGRITGGRC